MGKISPSSPLKTTAATGFLGRMRASFSGETKASTKPEMSEPRRRKGMPSRRTLRNATAKSPEWKENQGMGENWEEKPR
jgi:hypothetical protein